MIRCQICNAEISDEEIRDGRCPECMGLMTWAGQSFEQFDPMEEFENEPPAAEVPETPQVSDSTSDQTSFEPENDSRSDSQKMRDSTVEEMATNVRADQTLPPEDAERTPASMNELLKHSEQFSREIQQTIQPRALSDDQVHSLNEDWGQERSSHTDIQHTIKPQTDDARSRGTGSSLVVHRRLVMRSHESGADQSDYQIQEAIGEGGIGTVFAAQQCSVSRTVALKVLKPEYASVDEHRQKFIAEAIVIGDLDHPNIVPIYDLAKNDRESLFYTMKRVYGTPWTDVIDTNSLEHNIEILEKICDAIAFAHSRGVIHRDLKPDNVMLGDFGEVLVMDWGIALVKPESPKFNTLRESGEGLGGTPAYMAPEMATGPVETITNLSDVYLLGALLYRMLTGQAPHRGRNVRDCVEMAARNIIQPTSRNDELLEIALRAMSTQPEHRHRDVAAFKEALRKYKSHSESLLLSEKASEDLELAKRTKDYQIFSRAVFGFDEALLLWDENKSAISGRIKSREEYAQAAYEKEDFDLGLSLLDENEKYYSKLRAKFVAAIEDRNTRASQLQKSKLMFRGVLYVSAAAITLFAVKMWVDAGKLETANEGLTNAIRDANQAKDDANDAQKDAERNQLKAEKATTVALVEKNQSEISKKKTDIAVDETKYQVYMGQIALAAEKIESNAFEEATAILERYKDSPLRGWEWYRLWYLATMQSWTKDKTDQNLEAVTVSQNGKWIAAGGDGGEIVIWSTDELSDNKMGPVKYRTALPSGAQALSLEFSPYSDSKTQLAVGDSLANVFLIDIPEEQTDQKLELPPPLYQHQDAVLSVRFSPVVANRVSWLISSSKDGTARVWDLNSQKQTEQVVVDLKEHSWWVWDAVVSPQLDRLITAGQDGKITMWSIQWGEPKTKAQSPDKNEKETTGSKQFATYTQAYLQDPESPGQFAWKSSKVTFRDKISAVGLHEGPVYSLDYGDALQVASGGFDGRVLVWNPEQIQEISWEQLVKGQTPRPQKTVAECSGHTAPVHCVRFSPPDNVRADQSHLLLLSASDDNTLRRWDTRTGRLESTYREHGGFVRSCAFAPAKLKKFVSVGYDKHCRVWESTTYSETRVAGAEILSQHRDPILDAVYDRAGTLVASVSADRTLQVQKFDAIGGNPVEDSHQTVAPSLLSEGHDYLASTVVSFHNDTTRFLTSGLDGQAFLWGINSGVSIQRFDGVGNSGILKLSDDDKYVLTGGIGNEARLWTLNADENIPPQRSDLIGHDTRVTAVSFSPGSNPTWILTADATGNCAIRRRDKVDSLHWISAPSRSKAHSDQITDALFLNETTFATSSFDKSVRFWELSLDSEGNFDKATPFGNPISHPGAVVGMAFEDDQFLSVSVYSKPDVTDTDAAPVAQRKKHSVSQLKVIDWKTGTISQQEEIERGRVISAKFWKNAKRVLLVDDDNRIFDWELKQPIPDAIDTFKERSETIWSVIPAGSDNRWLTVGGRFAKLWSVPESGSQYPLLMEFGPHSTIETVSISSSQQHHLIATGDYSGQVKIWDAENKKILKRLETTHNGPIIAARFASSVSGDNLTEDFLLTAGGSNLMLWQENGAWSVSQNVDLNAVFATDPPGRLTFADYSPDLKLVITCHFDGRAFLWDLEQLKTGKAVLKFTFEPQTSLRAAAFSSDSKLIVLGGEDEYEKGHAWWNVEGDDWIKVGRISGHPTAITSLAISEDGTRLITGSEDKTIKLWDLSAVNFAQKADSSSEDILLHIEKIRDSLAELVNLLEIPTASRAQQEVVNSPEFAALFNSSNLLTEQLNPASEESPKDRYVDALKSLRGPDDGKSTDEKRSLSRFKAKLLDEMAKNSSESSATAIPSKNSDDHNATPDPTANPGSGDQVKPDYNPSELDVLEMQLLRLKLLMNEPLVEEIITLKGHARAVTSVAFAPAVEIEVLNDGEMGKKKIHPDILSASADGTVIRWPVFDHKQTTKINVANPLPNPSGPALR